MKDIRLYDSKLQTPEMIAPEFYMREIEFSLLKKIN